MKRNIFSPMVSVAVIIGLLLAACGAQSAAPTEAPSVPISPNLEIDPNALNQVVVSPNLKLLDRNVVSQMTLASGKREPITAYQLDQTGGVIKLANVDLTQVQFVQNQIITSGITEETPYGLLRKVVQVDKVGDNAVDLITVQATLEEVINTGIILAGTDDMILAANENRSYVRGGGRMMVMSRPLTSEIVIQIADVPLVDQGQNKKLVATGSIVIKPEFNLQILIEGSEVKEFLFSNKTKITSDVKINSNINLVNVKPQALLYTYPFKPITKMVGSLPVVITPILNVYVGFDGTVSAGFTTGLNYTNTLERGMSWKDGAWGPLESVSNPVFTPIEPAIKAVASAKVYIQPKLEILLYGVVGPYASIDSYILLSASPQKDPWWELTGVITAEVGVEFKMFSFLKKLVVRQQFEIFRAVFAQAPSDVAGEPEVPPPATEAPAEIPPTEEPQASAPPDGNNNSADSPPPAVTGNENTLLVYDNTSALVINMSQANIRVNGVEFKRIDNQGNVTASYPANIWGNFYGGWDSVPPKSCLRIALPKTSSASNCTVHVNFETSQAQYHFWRATSDSTQFRVLRNGEVVKTCEISAGSCSFYLP